MASATGIRKGGNAERERGGHEKIWSMNMIDTRTCAILAIQFPLEQRSQKKPLCGAVMKQARRGKRQ